MSTDLLGTLVGVVAGVVLLFGIGYRAHYGRLPLKDQRRLEEILKEDRKRD